MIRRCARTQECQQTLQRPQGRSSRGHRESVDRGGGSVGGQCRRSGKSARVGAAERVTGAEVEETVGDCAYGGGPTRRAFADEDRVLTAKVPACNNGDCFSKSEFAIDLEKREVRCPAGQTTSDYRAAKEGGGGRFVFAAATCQACPLRSQCVLGKGPRTISIQAEEGLQQQARAHNQTEAGRKSLRERVVVEHRIARLVQLGICRSRYFGKSLTAPGARCDARPPPVPASSSAPPRSGCGRGPVAANLLRLGY